LIDAATGAGKSHIIAAIAKTINQLSGGKKVLILAPSRELVEQNREKMLATGEPASIFSASAGSKCLRHKMVFGTPGTVINNIQKFGNEFACVVVDECHRITPTVKNIITEIKSANPNCRVIGLTATPYRMGSGYVYAIDENDKPLAENETWEPYFLKKVYTITAKELIDQGYLTPPQVGNVDEHYDTLHMQLNNMGQFNAADIDRAYTGQGRKTSRIIEDIVARSRNRKGVMIFAATIEHAQECMDSLPPELSAIVTGKTGKKEREQIIKDFKSMRIKFLVNVSVLTTGFDASHADVIAILRPTESVSLLQQIIGRGMRIHPGKPDFLLLDYAENIERHCPDGDLFKPVIVVKRKSDNDHTINATCPICNFDNQFKPRENEGDFEIDNNGYFCIRGTGERIEIDDGPIPAHYGRRCCNHILTGGNLVRCGYRWNGKECPDENCKADNDIAARKCHACGVEIVDPNEKLRLDFAVIKKTPTIKQTDEILRMTVTDTISSKGNPCLRVDIATPYRSFPVWFMPGKGFYNTVLDNKDDLKTVTYKKDGDFFRVYAFNNPADVPPPRYKNADIQA
jgi:DNA repair protein RadD